MMVFKINLKKIKVLPQILKKFKLIFKKKKIYNIFVSEVLLFIWKLLLFFIFILNKNYPNDILVISN